MMDDDDIDLKEIALEATKHDEGPEAVNARIEAEGYRTKKLSNTPETGNRHYNRHRSSDENNHGEDDGRHSRRKRRSKKIQYKYWDKAPPGFEHLTPTQYKEMQAQNAGPPPEYTNPGYADPIDPFSSTAHSSAGSGSNVMRQSRRLYVGNIPFGATEQEMIDFFNDQMITSGLAQGDGAPVIAAQINLDKNFAFLELRSVDETTQCMSFDSIQFKGQTLKLRRPRDYQAVGVSETSNNTVADSDYKIFIGGIPSGLSDDNVKALLLPIGALKSFNLIKDAATNTSKGFAFCEFADAAVTQNAIERLNGLSILDKHLQVQLASVGARTTDTTHATNAQQRLELMTKERLIGENKIMKDEMKTRILCLYNMVTSNELENDEEYQEIKDDIQEECTKLGEVIQVVIPRPEYNAIPTDIPNECPIYVEFKTEEDSYAAQQGLSGRRFNNNVVITQYFSVEKFYEEICQQNS